MGNHNVGRGMDSAARVFWQAWKNHSPSRSPSKDDALAALDLMAEDYRGADAEFDDSANYGEPLGNLIALAFGWSDEQEAADDDGEAWDEGPYMEFRTRYAFC
jgi:hypothetical protein